MVAPLAGGLIAATVRHGTGRACPSSMRTPTVTFRRVPETPAVEADIRKRLERLGTYCPSIMAARVLVEPGRGHHRAGNRFHVRIDLTVPGEAIVISHEPSVRPSARALAAPKTLKTDEPERLQRYLGVAIREAFAHARRRLQDYMRIRRGSVKQHLPPPGPGEPVAPRTAARRAARRARAASRA